MKIDKIISSRNSDLRPYWHIVWEWEDIMSEILQIPIEADSKIIRILKENRYTQVFFSGNHFAFDMNPWYRIARHGLFRASSNTIPYIIDFFMNEERLPSFIRMYEKAPVVFISSREVYEWLKQRDTKLNIEHLPISLSDKYKLSEDSQFQKQYDVVLLGRLSPSMEQYIAKYLEDNPHVSVLKRKIENNHFNFYDDAGNYAGNTDSREDYIDLMRKSRIILYSTPGCDDEKETNGFSQVTPRVLEALACGCHLIMKYPDNPDTRYFNLSKLGNSVETYEQFKCRMDEALSSFCDMTLYRSFLEQHYTSKRVSQLQNILNKYR